MSITLMEAGNFVARLNEYVQKNRLQLSYDFLGSDGPDHNKTFFLKAVVDGKPCPQGEGKTKKDAKQDAARKALKCLREEGTQITNISTLNTSTAAALQSPRNLNYICWLNEYGQKNRLPVRAVESTEVGANFAIQCCSFVVGNKEYPVASGATKREAKEKAAKIAHDEISGLRNTEMLTRSTVPKSRSSTRESSPQSTSTSSSDSVVFADSNSSEAQMSSRSSEYGASSRECSSSSSMQQYNYSSGMFTDSPSTSMDEINHLVERCTLDTPQKQKDGGQKARLEALKQRPSQLQRTETTQNGTSTPSKFLTDFDSIETISSGAYGCVFSARDKLEDKKFAVKIVHSGGTSLREVHTLSDLQHQNIVRYYTCWEEDEGYNWETLVGSSHSSLSTGDSPPKKFLYIKLELCDTKNLKDWIQDMNAQSLPDSKRREQSLSMALQLFSGVEYIHSMNVIHRDLKPANILFGKDRRGRKLKIGDFGLGTRDYSWMDRTPRQGTKSYMAPEQEKGRKYDRKVDIFALGLIYLEFLWKFSTGMERAEVFGNARQQKFPSEFPKRFFEEMDIIKSMLCDRPEGRPEAGEVRTQLETTAQAIRAQRTV